MVVLVVFMVLTAIALERAVVKRALQAEEDGLQLLIYTLLAAVDQDSQGFSITVSEDRLFEPSLIIRNSGLYALLYNRYKRVIWRSESIAESLPSATFRRCSVVCPAGSRCCSTTCAKRMEDRSLVPGGEDWLVKEKL